MSTDSKSVEEGIKIALDAADAATNVTDEFARIKQDYSSVEDEVKKLYRNAAIIFASSAVASLIAIIVASMMYYRTIEAMETSNNTSLEALVIFAENVDKLALATASLDESMAAQTEMSQTIADAQEALVRIEEQQRDASTKTSEQLTELGETTSAAVSQFSGAMLERFDTDFTQHTQEMAEAFAKLDAAQADLAASMAEASGGGSIQMDPALDMKLETVLMLQKEISAKITAANNPPQKARTPARTAPKPKPVRRTDPPISFP